MKRLSIGFALVMLLSPTELGWIGTRIYQENPSIPSKVLTMNGAVLVAEDGIMAERETEMAGAAGIPTSIGPRFAALATVANVCLLRRWLHGKPPALIGYDGEKSRINLQAFVTRSWATRI